MAPANSSGEEVSSGLVRSYLPRNRISLFPICLPGEVFRYLTALHCIAQFVKTFSVDHRTWMFTRSWTCAKLLMYVRFRPGLPWSMWCPSSVFSLRNIVLISHRPRRVLHGPLIPNVLISWMQFLLSSCRVLSLKCDYSTQIPSVSVIPGRSLQQAGLHPLPYVLCSCSLYQSSSCPLRHLLEWRASDDASIEAVSVVSTLRHSIWEHS